MPAFLKLVPRNVWIGLGVAVFVALAWFAHSRAVAKFGQAQFDKGVKHEQTRITKKVLALAAKSEKVSSDAQKLSRQDHRRIADRADNLRLLGPGKAACRPTISAPASGVRSDRSGSTAVVAVPDREREQFLAVPFAPAIAFAERCDAYRSEINSWRGWYTQQAEIWKKSN